MTGNPLIEIALLLVKTVFSIYIFAVMLRFILQWTRADFYNPLSQMLVKITNPPLIPLRRAIPGWKGIDFASIVLLFILEAIKLSLTVLLVGEALSIAPLIIGALYGIIELFIYLMIGIIIVSVILSWFGQGAQNPIASLLHQITEPMLSPFRRLIPPMGGLDLSPLFALLTLQIALILIKSVFQLIPTM